jgi:hypothetical protein
MSFSTDFEIGFATEKAKKDRDKLKAALEAVARKAEQIQPRINRSLKVSKSVFASYRQLENALDRVGNRADIVGRRIDRAFQKAFRSANAEIERTGRRIGFQSRAARGTTARAPGGALVATATGAVLGRASVATPGGPRSAPRRQIGFVVPAARSIPPPTRAPVGLPVTAGGLAARPQIPAARSTGQLLLPAAAASLAGRGGPITLPALARARAEILPRFSAGRLAAQPAVGAGAGVGRAAGIGAALGGAGRLALGGGLAGIAAGVVGGATVGAAKEAASYGAEIARTAQALLVSTDTLQQFRRGAEEAGVSTRSLEGGLVSFNARLMEARGGGGALVKTLGQLDPQLLANVTSAETTREAFFRFGDALAQIPNTADRAAVAQAALGKSNVELAQFLGQGSTAMMGLIAAGSEYARVWDADTIARAVEANAAFETASSAMESNLTLIKTELIPVGTAITEFFASVTFNVSGFIQDVGDFGRGVSTWIASLQEWAAQTPPVEAVDRFLGGMAARAEDRLGLPPGSMRRTKGGAPDAIVGLGEPFPLEPGQGDPTSQLRPPPRTTRRTGLTAAQKEAARVAKLVEKFNKAQTAAERKARDASLSEEQRRENAIADRLADRLALAKGAADAEAAAYAAADAERTAESERQNAARLKLQEKATEALIADQEKIAEAAGRAAEEANARVAGLGAGLTQDLLGGLSTAIVDADFSNIGDQLIAANRQVLIGLTQEGLRPILGQGFSALSRATGGESSIVGRLLGGAAEEAVTGVTAGDQLVVSAISAQTAALLGGGAGLNALGGTGLNALGGVTGTTVPNAPGGGFSLTGALGSLGGALAGGLSAVGGLLGGIGGFLGFERGGVVGRSGGAHRYISGGAFASAPRFQLGGIAGLRPGEVPIVAHQNELVAPMRSGRLPVQLRAGGGGVVPLPSGMQIPVDFLPAPNDSRGGTSGGSASGAPSVVFGPGAITVQASPGEPLDRTAAQVFRRAADQQFRARRRDQGSVL